MHATEEVGGRAASEVAMMDGATNIWLLTEPERTWRLGFEASAEPLTDVRATDIFGSLRSHCGRGRPRSDQIHGLKAVAIQGNADGADGV